VYDKCVVFMLQSLLCSCGGRFFYVTYLPFSFSCYKLHSMISLLQGRVLNVATFYITWRGHKYNAAFIQNTAEEGLMMHLIDGPNLCQIVAQRQLAE
jgi:hypothetical protein